MSPLFRIALAEVPTTRAGVGGGVLMTIHQTALALGVATLGILFLPLSALPEWGCATHSSRCWPCKSSWPWCSPGWVSGYPTRGAAHRSTAPPCQSGTRRQLGRTLPDVPVGVDLPGGDHPQDLRGRDSSPRSSPQPLLPPGKGWIHCGRALQQSFSRVT